MSNRRRVGRILAVGAAALVALAPMAAAHVTVNPGEAAKGGYAALAFRVPNERPDSGTTTVEVNIPEETPIASISVRPTPGWTYTVERRQLPEPLDLHGRRGHRGGLEDHLDRRHDQPGRVPGVQRVGRPAARGRRPDPVPDDPDLRQRRGRAVDRRAARRAARSPSTRPRC